MADIVYTVNQDIPESIAGFEQYSQKDKDLVSSFQINNVFDPTKHYSELHILSLADELLESTYDYTGFTELGNAQSAGQEGASVLTIDPIQDTKAYGYENAGVKLLYHFLDDLYSEDRTKVDFYIQDISTDRTELLLATLNLTPEVVTTITANIKANLQSQSYFTGFRLDFKNNDLFIATNIDTLDTDAGKVVVVKLYEPLPTTYNTKSILNIVDVVSDSVAYEVDAEYIIPPIVAPTLRSANFNIDITDESIIPTEYYNYNELFSYPINNANSQIFSTVSEKGIDISVDYTDFSDFIHFSSAQERLLNFKYKLDLVASYSQSIASGLAASTGLQGISGSRTYYENLITGVVSNFDQYDRFLYYESGSSSWPKSNTTKPYINKLSSNAESITWYANQIANAISYDNTNYNSLVYSIPTYLRDDANNENYLTFVYMVGQHFDNLWLYTKAVTDKYDADNRPNFGISKDLVAEALKNFGVKLYTSNKSVEDLFTTFIGQAYQSGSEKINNYITGSLRGSNTPIQPTAYDDYQKEVQKRIYHNLPLLLKSKGTERGLRALINCLGIPGDILDIKLYGGRNINEKPFFGDYQHYTSSLDKIRVDNTGSLVSGSTLSNYVSITKRDDKYTDDLHAIEVGFSPTDGIDQQIVRQLTCTAYYIELISSISGKYEYIDCNGIAQAGEVTTDRPNATIYAVEGSVIILDKATTQSTQQGTNQSDFTIDTYLGDPRNLTLDNYSQLGVLANTLLSGSLGTADHYNLQDYVRLIKFFDNTVFKMVKDFIPARAVVDTGIIIKPNLLNRSKAKSVTATGTRPEYTASIETGFTSGSDGGSFGKNNEYVTAYTDTVQTPLGLGNTTQHVQEQAKYNGELLGSDITVSTRDLNIANIYKYENPIAQALHTTVITTFPDNICVLASSYDPINITGFSTIGYIRNIQTNFSNLGVNNVIFTSASIDITEQSSNYAFTQLNYKSIPISASNPTILSCSGSILYNTQYCDYTTTSAIRYNILQNDTAPYNLTTWFTTGSNTDTSYSASINGASAVGIPNSGSYVFNRPTGTVVDITAQDNRIGSCKNTVTINTIASLYDSQRLISILPQGNQTIVYSYIPWNEGYGGPRIYSEPTIVGAYNRTIQVDQCIVLYSFEVNTGINVVPTYSDDPFACLD